MSDPTALARASAYPAYDPAGAVESYLDEFGALELAGWVTLGIGLAVAARFAPKLASPTASQGQLAPAPVARPILAAPVESLALETAAPAASAANALEPSPATVAPVVTPGGRGPAPPPVAEGRQMIVTREDP